MCSPPPLTNILSLIFFYLGLCLALASNIAVALGIFFIDFKFNRKQGDGADTQSLLSADTDAPQKEEESECVETGDFLTDVFEKYAVIMFHFWFIIIPVVVIACMIMIVGLYRIEFITDSLGLWVPDDCETMNNKRYYDEQFGPFFRLNQFMLMNKEVEGGPVITQPILMQNIQLINEIRAINVSWTNPNDTTDQRWVTMDDLCDEPIFGSGASLLQSLPSGSMTSEPREPDQGVC